MKQKATYKWKNIFSFHFTGAAYFNQSSMQYSTSLSDCNTSSNIVNGSMRRLRNTRKFICNLLCVAKQIHADRKRERMRTEVNITTIIDRLINITAIIDEYYSNNSQNQPTLNDELSNAIINWLELIDFTEHLLALSSDSSMLSASW